MVHPALRIDRVAYFPSVFSHWIVM